jgi:hypothetical protein
MSIRLVAITTYEARPPSEVTLAKPRIPRAASHLDLVGGLEAVELIQKLEHRALHLHKVPSF